MNGQPIVLYLLICLFYPLYHDITSLTSLKVTEAFHLLATGFCRKSSCLLGFQTQNNAHITEGSGNGDSNNWGPTVLRIYGHLTI